MKTPNKWRIVAGVLVVTAMAGAIGYETLRDDQPTAEVFLTNGYGEPIVTDITVSGPDGLSREHETLHVGDSEQVTVLPEATYPPGTYTIRVAVEDGSTRALNQTFEAGCSTTIRMEADSEELTAQRGGCDGFALPF